MTGNTASTPLPAGPIRKLKVTTKPTSKATILARIPKSYQGRVVGGMRTRRNGTIKRQSAKTARLRTNADHAVQWTGPSTKAAASHTANARDMLIHIDRRGAIKTYTLT